MLKNFLSLVKPNNKEKKKKKSVSGPSASTPVATDTSFFSEADASILSNSPPKDVVVHRRSLQPTATPNHSDAEHSFIENIFDSPGQRNRLHSMIGESIYETGSGSPQKMTNKNVIKKL